MFGKLARWLRMLSHDELYYKSVDDAKLLMLAKSEKRIILTRDLGLYQKAKKNSLKAHFFKETTVAKNLAELAKEFDIILEIDLNTSRCPKCNSEISAISKLELIGLIPEETSGNYNNYWKCETCSQIYWQGAHWKRIKETLEESKNYLQNF